MKSIKIIMLLIAISLNFTSCEAKIKNVKTETYKVWGNCGMCQETIEKAVKQKNIAKGKWNQTTKMIVITYDSTKTNADEILKRIAQVGYDNDKYTAPNEAYNKRPQCCQYKRK
jgi:copper chaperone CopZ